MSSCLLTAVVLCCCLSALVSALGPGDLMFEAIVVGSGGGVVLVSTTYIPGGTSLYLTTKKWNSTIRTFSGSFAPEIVTPNRNSAPPGVSLLCILEATTLQNTGTLFLYQGSEAHPQFIAALIYGGATTDIPVQLSSNNASFIYPSSVSNPIVYKGSANIASRSTLLVRLTTFSNWQITTLTQLPTSLVFPQFDDTSPSLPPAPIPPLPGIFSPGAFAPIGLTAGPASTVYLLVAVKWPAGTPVSLTNCGWNDFGNNVGALSSLGQVITVAPAQSIPANTFISIDLSALNLTLLLADQLFMFEGPPSNPKFIFGVTTNSQWDGLTYDASSSALPSQLAFTIYSLALQPGLYQASTVPSTIPNVELSLFSPLNWAGASTIPPSGYLQPPVTFTSGFFTLASSSVAFVRPTPTVNLFPTVMPTLKPGDLVIVGFSSALPSPVVAVLATVNIPCGTVIGFTDMGWTSSGAFLSDPSDWEAPFTFLNFTAAGSVVNISLAYLDLQLDPLGDQLFIFQSSLTNASFIFGFGYGPAQTWSSTASNGLTSALPRQLSNAGASLYLNSSIVGAAAYIGQYSLTLSMLTNPSSYIMAPNGFAIYAIMPFSVIVNAQTATFAAQCPVASSSVVIASSSRVLSSSVVVHSSTAAPLTTQLPMISAAPAPSNGLVRLVGGTSSLNGRVEISYNGTWGSVCDDGMSAVSAGVICRQLGFNYNGAIVLGRDSASQTIPNITWLPLQAGNIWLDSVSCTPLDTSLAQCAHDPYGVSDCTHAEDVGVQCLPAPSSSLLLVASSSVILTPSPSPTPVVTTSFLPSTTFIPAPIISTSITVNISWCFPGLLPTCILPYNLTTTIHVGDTVAWFVTDSAIHTVNATNGLFDSGPLTESDNGLPSFSFTFETAGVVAYQCSFHPMYMVGTIIVLPLPPGTVPLPSSTALAHPTTTYMPLILPSSTLVPSSSVLTTSTLVASSSSAFPSSSASSFVNFEPETSSSTSIDNELSSSSLLPTSSAPAAMTSSPAMVLIPWCLGCPIAPAYTITVGTTVVFQNSISLNQRLFIMSGSTQVALVPVPPFSSVSYTFNSVGLYSCRSDNTQPATSITVLGISATALPVPSTAHLTSLPTSTVQNMAATSTSAALPSTILTPQQQQGLVYVIFPGATSVSVLLFTNSIVFALNSAAGSSIYSSSDVHIYNITTLATRRRGTQVIVFFYVTNQNTSTSATTPYLPSTLLSNSVCTSSTLGNAATPPVSSGISATGSSGASCMVASSNTGGGTGTGGGGTGGTGTGASQSSGSGGLAIGAIIGIAVGGGLLLLLIILLVCFCCVAKPTGKIGGKIAKLQAVPSAEDAADRDYMTKIIELEKEREEIQLEEIAAAEPVKKKKTERMAKSSMTLKSLPPAEPLKDINNSSVPAAAAVAKKRNVKSTSDASASLPSQSLTFVARAPAPRSSSPEPPSTFTFVGPPAHSPRSSSPEPPSTFTFVGPPASASSPPVYYQPTGLTFLAQPSSAPYRFNPADESIDNDDAPVLELIGDGEGGESAF